MSSLLVGEFQVGKFKFPDTPSARRVAGILHEQRHRRLATGQRLFERTEIKASTTDPCTPAPELARADPTDTTVLRGPTRLFSDDPASTSTSSLSKLSIDFVEGADPEMVQPEE